MRTQPSAISLQPSVQLEVRARPSRRAGQRSKKNKNRLQPRLSGFSLTLHNTCYRTLRLRGIPNLGFAPKATYVCYLPPRSRVVNGGEAGITKGTMTDTERLHTTTSINGEINTPIWKQASAPRAFTTLRSCASIAQKNQPFAATVAFTQPEQSPPARSAPSWDETASRQPA